MDWWQEGIGIAGAFACGVLIGIERGWTQRHELPGTRVAGIRTFSLLGLAGGVAGVIAAQGAALAGGAVLAGAVLILLRSRRPDPTLPPPARAASDPRQETPP